MAFSIGANDAANSLGVSYGTNAISLPKLIIIGAVAEFLGGMFCSQRVSTLLGSKIIKNILDEDVIIQEIIMLSVCFSTFVFIAVAVKFGMPISGTQAVVGALMGAGWVMIGAEELNFLELRHIATSWVTSPLLSGCISFLLMIMIAKFSMDTKHLSYKSRILCTQLVIAFCSSILADYIHDFVVDPEVTIDKKKSDILTSHMTEKKDAYGNNMRVIIITFIVATILSRFIYLLMIMQLNVKAYSLSTKLKFAALSIFMPHKTDFLEEITCTVNICSKDEEEAKANNYREIMYSNYKQICKLFSTTTMRHQIDFLIIDPRTQDFEEYINRYNTFSEGRIIDKLEEEDA